ncbi:MAG: bifunctional DNA-binding transcriptional regulator/O6-methylguanine-DNA methyltransferase Ada [Nitrospiraceae bacterium]
MPTAAAKHSQAASTVADPRWAMVVARAPEASAQFVYSVSTTGIYCRPSCPARLARPEHVRFHENAREAERAGFRPCKRCTPTESSLQDRHLDIVTRACRMIERADEPVTLAHLAVHVGLSPFHLQRIFTKAVGMSPRAYARSLREQRIRAGLPHGRSITSAIFDAGYRSSSRFYAYTGASLGMTPTAYRTGGVGETIRVAVGHCSLGALLVASTEQGVCAILLGDEPDALLHDVQRRFPRAQFVGGDRAFERLVAQVVGLIDDPSRRVDLPLDIRGTVFQQRVWTALRGIPPGRTLSYRELATRLGVPNAVRAVASACAANPLAVAIPCHRVVRTNGDLAGYRWGLARKRTLLKKESESSC